MKKQSLSSIFSAFERTNGKRGVSAAAAEAIRRVATLLFHPVSPRAYLRVFLVVWFALLLGWAALVWFVDPFVCFHRAWGLKQVYDSSYAMIPGLLRNFNYDTVLIGSSMCRNCTISGLNSVAGGSSLKATSAGQTGDDVGAILRILLEEQRAGRDLKHLIIGVDFWAFAKGETGQWRNYRHLYDRRVSWEYFFSQDTLSALVNCFVTNLASADVKGAANEKDFDRMFGDKVWRFTYSRAEMERHIREVDEAPAAVTPETMGYVLKFLLEPLAGHDRLRVDVIFSPYSAYFWAMLLKTGKLDGYLASREAFALEAERRCPFIRIHDFQCDESIVCDFDNYKDINHFSPRINALLLDRVRAGSHVSGVDRIRENNRKLRQLAQEYLPRYEELIRGRRARKGKK